MFYLLRLGLTQVGKKLPNQAPDPKLAFYSERWGQRCIIHILVHNTEAKLFSEVSPVWKLLPPSLPTPKTYCIFTRATSIRPTPSPPPFFWYKLCKTFVLGTFFPPQTNKQKIIKIKIKKNIEYSNYSSTIDSMSLVCNLFCKYFIHNERYKHAKTWIHSPNNTYTCSEVSALLHRLCQ